MLVDNRRPGPKPIEVKRKVGVEFLNRSKRSNIGRAYELSILTAMQISSERKCSVSHRLHLRSRGFQKAFHIVQSTSYNHSTHLLPQPVGHLLGCTENVRTVPTTPGVSRIWAHISCKDLGPASLFLFL